MVFKGKIVTFPRECQGQKRYPKELLRQRFCRTFGRTFFGDKFGESLGGSQAPPSFWKVPGLPQKFPRLPRKFFGDFPGSSLTAELNNNTGVPRKFPKLPRKFPKLPRKFLDFPEGQPLSLGSLTPSPDSQKLSLISGAVCLKTLVLLGSALELFRNFFGTVRAISWVWGSFLAPESENVLQAFSLPLFWAMSAKDQLNGVARTWGRTDSTGY